MVGNNTIIPERDLSTVDPIRFKILVEVLPDKPRSTLLHMPDTLKQGDTSRRAFWARIVKVGSLVKGTAPGLLVTLDPSLDVMSAMRCFKWEGKHYMLADVSDIIMVQEDADAKQEACAKS